MRHHGTRPGVGIWAGAVKPEPGFYRIRLRRGHAKVPARIIYGPPLDPETFEELDRSWRLQVEIGDRKARTEKPFWIERVFLEGDRIDAETYRYMRDRIAWARVHEPDAPVANWQKPVDLNRMRPPF